MTVIPSFIIKRMYKQGSLKRTATGVSFEIINNLGSGMIVKINHIQLNDKTVTPEEITLFINEKAVPANQITESNPASFSLNQVVRVEIVASDLPAGDYKMSLDLVSKEAGQAVLSVGDKLA